MYRLKTFAVVVACILPISGCEAKPIDRILDASVQIEVMLPLGSLAIGSGTIVRDRELGLGILTARHVAEGLPFMYQACRLDEPTNCVELHEYVTNSGTGLEDDWAWFSVDELPDGSHPVGFGRHPKLGDSIWMAGVPNGMPLITTGSVAWDVGVGWTAQGFGYPGSSGGGCFNTRGELIGVTVALPVLRDPLGFPAYETSLPLIISVENVRFLTDERTTDEGYELFP